MSPQLLKEESYNYKCDIWALGIIAYEMVVGNWPWEVSSQQFVENIKKEVNFPKDLQISEDYKSFVKDCLTYD